MQVKQLGSVEPEQQNNVTGFNPNSSSMNYRPPLPTAGAIVQFYIDGDVRQSPSAAFVTHVEDRCIDLNVVDSRTGRMTPHGEVYFVEDPWIRERQDIRHFGGWDFHPDYYRLEAAETRIELLEERLKNLEEELGSKPEKNSKKPA